MNTSSENLLLIALSWYEIVIVSNFPTVTSDCLCKYQKSKGKKTFIEFGFPEIEQGVQWTTSVCLFRSASRGVAGNSFSENE